MSLDVCVITIKWALSKKIFWFEDDILTVFPGNCFTVSLLDSGLIIWSNQLKGSCI